jgi:hypothetical protein
MTLLFSLDTGFRRYDDERTHETEMPTIDLKIKTELYTKCELYAQKLQFWRLCASGRCRRAKQCHDARGCVLRIGEWYEAVQDAANRERNANDPHHQALVEDLKQRVMRLSKQMADERAMRN